jgi:uncharacterized membrane protein YbhN (UPF0104 family)
MNIRNCLIMMGIFSISWLLGYYVFIFPSGLGIREGVQVYLLSYFFPPSISIVIALVCRIWMTLGDGIISLIAIALAKWIKEEDIYERV